MAVGGKVKVKMELGIFNPMYFRLNLTRDRNLPNSGRIFQLTARVTP